MTDPVDHGRAVTDDLCHCGRAVYVHEDLGGFTRYLCVDCDSTRCDAYPLDCVYSTTNNKEDK